MIHNFSSCVAADVTRSPHELFEAMAVDAAMLAMNDRLPEMRDGEIERLQEVAAHVAQTLLRLGHIPNTWLDFLARVPAGTLPQLRDDIAPDIYERLPGSHAPSRVLRDNAIKTIHALTPTEYRQAVKRALDELDDAASGQLVRDADAAFALGWQLARDAGPLVFKAKERGHADGA